MPGPDGWRFARIQWPKGIHNSRKLHYFKDGGSLCSAHHDGITGWHTEVKEVLDTYLKGFRCKKCLSIGLINDPLSQELIKRAAADSTHCPKCGTELEEDPEDSSEGYCPKCNYGWRFPR